MTIKITIIFLQKLCIYWSYVYSEFKILRMILVIGEILIDLIGEDNNDGIDLTARLGGAPFNVASNLSFLDVPTTFYGVVGIWRIYS